MGIHKKLGIFCQTCIYHEKVGSLKTHWRYSRDTGQTVVDTSAIYLSLISNQHYIRTASLAWYGLGEVTISNSKYIVRKPGVSIFQKLLSFPLFRFIIMYDCGSLECVPREALRYMIKCIRGQLAPIPTTRTCCSDYPGQLDGQLTVPFPYVTCHQC